MDISIIDFIEDEKLINDQSLSAAQKMSLKAVYGMALTKEERRIWRTVSGCRTYRARERSEATFILGRRAGKSDKLASNIALYEACARQHKFSVGEHGVVQLVASEKRRQARILHDYCLGKLERSPVLRKMIKKVLVDEISLKNDVRIQIYPAATARIRAPSLVAFIGDEVAFWKSREDLRDIDVEVLNAARPALSFPHSKLIKISTPYMAAGEIFEDHRRYWGKDSDVLVFKGSSTLFNPTLGADWEARIKRRGAAVYGSEVLAEFRKDLSTMYVPEGIDDAMSGDRPMELPYSSENTYIAFVDVAGGGGRDSYALAIGHMKGDRIIIDVVRSRKPRFNPNEVTGDLAALVKEYGLREVTGDKFSGDFALHSWAARNVDYLRSLKTKAEIYIEAESVFNTQRVEIPERKTLEGQLKGLMRRTRSGGKDSVDMPSGMPDDEANVVCGVIDLLAGESAADDVGPEFIVTAKTPESELVEERAKRPGKVVPHPLWSTPAEQEERKRMGAEAAAERKRKGIVLKPPTPEELKKRKQKAIQDAIDEREREKYDWQVAMGDGTSFTGKGDPLREALSEYSGPKFPDDSGEIDSQDLAATGKKKK